MSLQPRITPSVVWLVLAAAGLRAVPAGGTTYTFEFFEYPGAVTTGFRGINKHGNAVGFYQTGPGLDTVHALLYSGGSLTNIDPPGPSTDNRAFGINDAGVVVGSFQQSGQHGFILAGGTYTTVNYPGAGGSTTIRSINNAGDLAGEWDDASDVRHGFIRVGSVFSPIDFPGAPSTRARYLSDAGQVLGHFDDPDVPGLVHAFLREGTTYQQIDYPGAASTLGGVINAAGDILGLYLDASGTGHMFLLRGGTFTTIDVPGAVSVFPGGMNNFGQISGQAADAAGVTRAFIATPVPEPAGLVLALAGCVVVVVWFRGRRH